MLAINGFKEFLIAAKHDLKYAALNRLEIRYDSYFFGSKKDSTNSEMSYKIADFDTIEKHPVSASTSKIYDSNCIEFGEAIALFLKYFTQNGENKRVYLELVENTFGVSLQR